MARLRGPRAVRPGRSWRVEKKKTLAAHDRELAVARRLSVEAQRRKEVAAGADLARRLESLSTVQTEVLRGGSRPFDGRTDSQLVMPSVVSNVAMAMVDDACRMVESSD